MKTKIYFDENLNKKIKNHFDKTNITHLSIYNRLSAVNYAKKWAFEKNPAYENFDNLGGDCTNFVSQCLHAGGIKMNYEKYGWFYKNLNDRAPAWSGVNEFYNFSLKNTTSAGVKAKEIEIEDAKIGDVIILKNEEKLYHSLIITNIIQPISKRNILVTSHDNDVLDKPLSHYFFQDFKILNILN